MKSNMEYDKLTCIQCGSHWNRPKSRGRKPKLCPSCLQSPQISVEKQQEEDNDEIEAPLIPEPPLAKTKYKAGSKWKCHSCLATVQIGVGHDEPPVHSCRKRLKKIYPLELI